MKLLAFSILFALFVQLDANKIEPNGKLYLNSLFINDFLEPDYHDSANISMTCSTLSTAGRVQFVYHTVGPFKRLELDEGRYLNIEILSHETVECELSETLEDEELDNSHGYCDFTYSRFLSATNNTVLCHLPDRSSFEVRMMCDPGCPNPIPPPASPYCKPFKKILPSNTGEITDGSPGFALYAPNSSCVWRIPNKKNSAINFLFTRLDLGSGDKITFYSSGKGKKKKKIQEYVEDSVPTSVSTDANYLILEFESDAVDEGLGFAGFYYYTAGTTDPVAIATQEPDVKNEGDVGMVGRKFV